MLRNIDSLLTAEQYDTAIAVLEPKLRENADDWELLYREGFALAKRRPADVPARFQAILDLTTSDDELGVVAKNRLAKQKSQPASARERYRRRSSRCPSAPANRLRLRDPPRDRPRPGALLRPDGHTPPSLDAHRLRPGTARRRRLAVFVCSEGQPG